MKNPNLFTKNANAIALSLLLLTAPRMVFAEDTASSIQTVDLDDGTSIGIIIVNSPSPPPEPKMAVKEAFSSVAATGDVKITGVPAFTWSYGASNTAGAMIAGYYDRVGFTNMYTGPTNGGCMPLTNVSWGLSSKGLNQCPLSATAAGVDGRTNRGHVDDYFVSDLSKGPDPYVAYGSEHTIGDCTGDYMKTSKWFPNSASDLGLTSNINQDGSAFFTLDLTGGPMTASMLESPTLAKYALHDAGYGLKLFFESRGYTVATMYNQYIDTVKAAGFTYEYYKAEIDAGRPVLLHLSGPTGHDVVGIGYNVTNEEIIFHDPSRNPIEQRMIWGGIYNTVYTHTAVTIVTLANAINPETGCGVSNSGTGSGQFPWTMFLPAITNSKK